MQAFVTSRPVCHTVAVIQVNNNRYIQYGFQFDDLDNLKLLQAAVDTLRTVCEEVVLAAPDLPENKVFEGLNVSCHRGDEEDVGKRICDALRSRSDDTIVVRTYAEQTLHTGVVLLQIHHLMKHHLDYASPPEGACYRYGAEVFTLGALRKVVAYIQRNGLKDHRIRPFALMREIPQIRRRPLASDQVTASGITTAPVRLRKGRFGIENAGNYRFVADHCRCSDTVLDMGCGNGLGGVVIGPKVKEYLGIDIAPYNISYAQEHFHRDNVHFREANVLTFPTSGAYDRVVCLYLFDSMSGPAQYRHLVRNAGAQLCCGGTAYFAAGLWEPDAIELSMSRQLFRQLMCHHFSSVEIMGLDKGLFVSEDAARESIFAVCREPKAWIR